MNQVRTPPHSIEHERAVLGMLMFDSDAYADVAARLDSMAFYRQEHRVIYRAIASLCEAGEPAEPINVLMRLDERGDLARAGGADLVRTIASSDARREGLEYAVTVVKRRYTLRRLITEATAIVDAAYSNPSDYCEFMARSEEALLDLIRDDNAASYRHIREAGREAVDNIAARQAGNATGIPIPWEDVEEEVGAIEPGDLTILAARPGMGKSAFAFQWATHCAAERDQPVGVLSLEMRGEQVFVRMAVQESRTRNDLITGSTIRLNEAQWVRFMGGMKRVSEAPIWLGDERFNMREVEAVIRQMHRKHGVGVVFLDYLQIITKTDDRLSDTAHIKAAVSAIKTIAKELRVAIVCLAQLNRECEKRQDKRPMLSDLGESGQIEREADQIIFLYRDDYYDDESPCPGVCEVIVAKNRNGSLGVARLNWTGPSMVFDTRVG